MMVQEYEPMKFEDLSSVYRVESRSQALSDVRKDLYHAIVQLCDKVRKDHDAALAEDPDSIMCEGLGERRKKAASLSQKIVDLRMEKVMIMALRKSMGAPTALDKLTPEEREYYEQIVVLSDKHRSLILKDAKNRNYVIPDISSAGAAEPEAAPMIQGAGSEISDDVPDDLIISTEREDIVIQSSSHDDEEFIVIRILEDLPPIAGPEFDYNLKKEEVVRMPSKLANTLINHEKAVPLKLTP